MRGYFNCIILLFLDSLFLNLSESFNSPALNGYMINTTALGFYSARAFHSICGKRLAPKMNEPDSPMSPDLHMPSHSEQPRRRFHAPDPLSISLLFFFFSARAQLLN